MKTKVAKATLRIGYRVGYDLDAHFAPHTCDEMQVVGGDEFLVPVHEDQMGTNSSLQVFDPEGTERFPVEMLDGGGTPADRSYYTGMRKYRISVGDKVVMGTTCCIFTAEVLAVDAPCNVSLGSVVFDGPWGNFNSGSCLTFGWVSYHETGLEPVTATAFRGTISEYRQLRNEEEATRETKRVASGDSYPEYWGQEKFVEFRRQRRECALPNPTHERAEKLAEALGL